MSAVIACYKDGQAIPVMYERLTRHSARSASTTRSSSSTRRARTQRGGPPRDQHRIRTSSASRIRETSARRWRFAAGWSFDEGRRRPARRRSARSARADPEFYAQWEEGTTSCTAARQARDAVRAGACCTRLFYRVFAAFSYVKIPLDAGDFSLMDRRVVGWLLNCGERDLFVRGLRAYVGFRQAGVDYVRPERAFGRSTNNFFKNIEWAKRDLLLQQHAADDADRAGHRLARRDALAHGRSRSAIFFPAGAAGRHDGVARHAVFGSLNLFAIGLVASTSRRSSSR